MSAIDSKHLVKTAARTLDVFEVFAEARAPLTLSDLARRLDIPLSSCHALVRTLQRRGYLYVFDRQRLIYPTRRLAEVARTIVANDPVLERIGPFLEQLRDATGETVLLGKREGDVVRYLDVVEGTHTIRYTAAPGEAKPLHSSAIGKCLLGALPQAACAALLARLPLPEVTAITLTSASALQDDLCVSRARGYFATRGENVADVMALAVERTLAGDSFGIALAGPITRMTRHEDAYAARLIAIADALAGAPDRAAADEAP